MCLSAISLLTSDDSLNNIAFSALVTFHAAAMWGYLYYLTVIDFGDKTGEIFKSNCSGVQASIVH